MTTLVSVRTKLVIAGGFLAFAVGIPAALWLLGANPKSTQQQCADKCFVQGRGYDLVAKQAPMSAHGVRPTESECVCR